MPVKNRYWKEYSGDAETDPIRSTGGGGYDLPASMLDNSRGAAVSEYLFTFLRGLMNENCLWDGKRARSCLGDPFSSERSLALGSNVKG